MEKNFSLSYKWFKLDEGSENTEIVCHQVIRLLDIEAKNQIAECLAKGYTSSDLKIHKIDGLHYGGSWAMFSV